MVTSFKIRCLRFIEKSLSLPQTSFFIKNESAIRLCYIKDGEYQYINLASPGEVARFMKKHQLIHMYSTCGDVVTMFRRELKTTTGAGEQPIQKWVLQRLSWNEIEFTANQVLTLAAAHELRRNKVVNMFIKEVFVAA